MAGLVSLGLGIVGIVLPILPTVPFILLASFCFSRSSERLHQWMLNHPKFGKSIRDWEVSGIIPRKAKLAGTGSIALLGSYPLVFLPVPLPAKIAAGVTMALVIAYIWSKPSE